MRDTGQLLATIRRDFAAAVPSSDRAWSRAPALRVMDCVLSLNRPYDSFVVPRLDSLEQQCPVLTTIRDLRQLIDSFPSPAASVRDALTYRDAARARVISEVVGFLLGASAAAHGTTELNRLGHWARSAQPDDYRSPGIPGGGRARPASMAVPDAHRERLLEGVDLPAFGYRCVQFVSPEKATRVVLRRQAR